VFRQQPSWCILISPILPAVKVWPADRREHARYQALARAELDAAKWEVAWQEGRANPLSYLVAPDEIKPQKRSP
jgi:hypothetical protein